MDGQIEELVNIKITLTKEELKPALDEFWEREKNRLPPQVKKAAMAGFREPNRTKAIRAYGGPSVFYAPLLRDKVVEYTIKQGREALLIHDISFHDLDDKYIIDASLVLEPNIRWKREPNNDWPELKAAYKIDFDIEATKEKLKKQEIENRLRQLDEIIEVDEPIQDGMLVDVKCDASWVDGAGPYEDGTFDNNRWAIQKDMFKHPEVYDALLDLRTGDSAGVVINVGDNVILNITVLKVYRINRPELNDETAITLGFEDLENMNHMIEIAAKKAAVNMFEAKRQEAVVNVVVNPDHVQIDKLSTNWLMAKAANLVQEVRRQFTSDAKVLEYFKVAKLQSGKNVESMEDLFTYMAENAAAEFATSMVLRSWGKHVGVEGDSRLAQLTDYANLVKTKLLETAGS